MKRNRSFDLEPRLRFKLIDFYLDFGKDLVFDGVLDFILEDDDVLENVFDGYYDILSIAFSEILWLSRE